MRIGLKSDICVSCYYGSVCSHKGDLNRSWFTSNLGSVRRSRERGLELFCPKDFHGYGGVDVCLLFCCKKRCSVFKLLRKADSDLLRI